MPRFSYKGYEAGSGQPKKGVIEADTKKLAKAKLKQRDKIIAYELKEEVASEKLEKKGVRFGAAVKLPDLAIMTRQFATLQKAHVPIDDSLRALSSQVDNVLLQNTMSALKDQVSEGKSLAEASSKYPKIFNKLYVNMLSAGEQSGTLGVVLDRLADFLEYQVKIRGQVMSALAYPAIMIFASLGIIAYLFVSVVPKLQKVFISLKVKLPWYTETLISLSEGVQKHWLIIIIVVVILVYGFKKWRDSENGRQRKVN